MPIRVLDSTVAAQIAAGEVVERPASVARELIENALDAGGRRIAVEVRGGGLRELKVQDDGHGIPADEVELAFARHATSKLLSADDLWSIGTLGFRGEALPSIASVAQVVCTTRAVGEEVGVELRIAGGELQGRAAAGCPIGTAISVRNLFYNTPVRREFLRSEATEASAVAALVTQYALAYPEVRFSLTIDGRLALQTSGASDLRAVLIELYGLDVARQLLPVEASFGEGREAITVSGLISPPGLTRSSRSALHLFVNRRVVQPRGPLAIVIEEAYQTLLMRGRHPLAALNISVHPTAVDVNVHPTKSEVKFRDTGRVLSVISRAVRSALLESGARPWDEGDAPPLEAAQRRFELRRIGGDWGERASGRAGDEAFTGEGLWGQPAAAGEFQVEGAPSSAPTPPQVASRLPPLRILGQAAQTYIVADTADGLLLIDQHAAHERIVYERLVAQRAAGPVERQSLLIPQTLDMPPETHALLSGSAATLDEWGFEVEDFGGRLRVRSAPAGLPEGAIADALTEIAAQLEQPPRAQAAWQEAMLIAIACHSAVRAGQSLSPEEQHELVAQLGRCQAPRTCPHGRPTMILLSGAQLERQFGRSR